MIALDFGVRQRRETMTADGSQPIFGELFCASSSRHRCSRHCHLANEQGRSSRKSALGCDHRRRRVECDGIETDGRDITVEESVAGGDSTAGDAIVPRAPQAGEARRTPRASREVRRSE